MTTMNLRKEVVAGITTFMAMAYIIFLNPIILSQASLPATSQFLATSLSAALASLVAACWFRMPLGMAPGMTLNTFFVTTLCSHMGFSWHQALVVVFLTGVVLSLVAYLCPARLLHDLIPEPLQHATLVGIGGLIACLAVKHLGMSMHLWAWHTAQLVDLLLTLGGAALMWLLRRMGLSSAILLGMALITGMHVMFGSVVLPSSWMQIPQLQALHLARMDWSVCWQIKCWGAVAILSLIMLFDVSATLKSLFEGYLPSKRTMPETCQKGMLLTGLSTLGAGLLGTSPINPYFESLLGIQAGGRGGVTAFVIACCFCLALWFSPVLSMIPAEATSAGLFMVAMSLMAVVATLIKGPWHQHWYAWILIGVMLISQSIATGIAWGQVAYMGDACVRHRSMTVMPAYHWAMTCLLLVGCWFA